MVSARDLAGRDTAAMESAALNSEKKQGVVVFSKKEITEHRLLDFHIYHKRNRPPFYYGAFALGYC